MQSAYIVGAKRSIVSPINGPLSSLQIHELAAPIINNVATTNAIIEVYFATDMIISVRFDVYFLKNSRFFLSIECQYMRGYSKFLEYFCIHRCVTSL